MVVLEVGINVGMKNLVEIRYYSSPDSGLDPKIRALFFAGLENYVTEVYGDQIKVISLSRFQIIFSYKEIRLPGEEEDNTQPLLSYAITEKEIKVNFVHQHLKEILSDFLKKYTPKDIFSKDPRYFFKFHPRIDRILGDLKLSTEDRIGSVIRKREKEEEEEAEDDEEDGKEEDQ
ncbi:MAG: hypothetical protein ACXABO_00545 [Promethearchaeota archaeon]|jgi:hypothetical protein